MPDEEKQSIEDAAASPRRVKGDSGEVEQHSLKEQIEAERFVASKKATQGKGLGIRISKMIPPGA